MKKSDLKKYIKENILTSLSEGNEEEIKSTNDLTVAVQGLKKAKDEAGIEEMNIGLADLEEMGYEAGENAFESVKGQFQNKPDFQSFKKGYIQGFVDNASSYGLNENEDEDAEPKKSDIKANKGFNKAKDELALLTQEMKSLAKKYSSAEGEEKEKLVKALKDKTKLKKELESIVFKKKM